MPSGLATAVALQRRGHDVTVIEERTDFSSGAGISIWPKIVPPTISIWDAASPPQSQGFALVGALLIIPMILVYTAWAYYVFRGKVRHDDGYHH